MADVSSQHQHSESAAIDASIDSLLTGVETADANHDATASPDVIVPELESTDAAGAAAALDDALVMDLMQGASAEIESVAPGPMELPPLLEDAEVSPAQTSATDALSQSPEFQAPASFETHAEPAITAELQSVNDDLERPFEHTIDASPASEPQMVASAQDVTALSLDEVAADVAQSSTRTNAAPDDPAAALADEMREVEASLAAAHDAAKVAIAVTPPAPGITSQPPALDADMQFLSPEEIERDIELAASGATPSHEKSTSVRELDEHLANAAPHAVEAAISAAAAKVEEQAAAAHTAAQSVAPSLAASALPALNSVPASSQTASDSNATAGPSPDASSPPSSTPLSSDSAPPSPRRSAREALAPVAGAATAALGAALSPLAKIHAKLGEPMRQTIGYVAAMTMLFAVASWAFFLLRGQPKLDAVSPQKHLLMPGEAAPSDHSSGAHGEDAHSAAANQDQGSGDSHAPSKADASSHGAAKKESASHGAPAKKDAGGHSTAKKPPAKKDAKKDAKKATAH